MNFTVTVLGSGAALPTLARHCSAQAVNVEGFRMLIDCGEATQNQIRCFHQKMQSFSTIFISHLHGDHLFGLPGLLSSMHLCGRTEPVTVYAPKGIKAALNILFDISSTRLQYNLTIIEMEHEGAKTIFENAKCKVIAFPLPHSVPTYGFRIEEHPPLPNLRKDIRNKYQLTPIECQNIKLGADYVTLDGLVIPNSEITLPPRKAATYAYCCDTAYTEEILPFIEGVDMLCMESTFENTHKDLAEEKLHCTAEQAASLAAKAHAGKLLLTHFSARYKEMDTLFQEASNIFPNTILAEDGMSITI